MSNFLIYASWCFRNEQFVSGQFSPGSLIYWRVYAGFGVNGAEYILLRDKYYHEKIYYFSELMMHEFWKWMFPKLFNNTFENIKTMSYWIMKIMCSGQKIELKGSDRLCKEAELSMQCCGKLLKKLILKTYPPPK